MGVRIERGDGWEMRLGKFQDVLADVRCDSVITDPPYLGASPTGSQAGLAEGRGGASAVPKAYRSGPGAQMMEYAPATPDLLDRLVTWAFGSASCFLFVLNDYPGIKHLDGCATKAGWNVSKQPVVWVRKMCLPSGFLWRPTKSCEFAMVAARARPSIKRERPGHYECFPPSPNVGKVENRSQVVGQKPVNLMRAIVRDYSESGMLICDPFAGSGTTGVAAIKEGRRFIGSEMDPARFAICCDRLNGCTQQEMFQ